MIFATFSVFFTTTSGGLYSTNTPFLGASATGSVGASVPSFGICDFVLVGGGGADFKFVEEPPFIVPPLFANFDGGGGNVFLVLALFANKSVNGSTLSTGVFTEGSYGVETSGALTRCCCNCVTLFVRVVDCRGVIGGPPTPPSFATEVLLAVDGSGGAPVPFETIGVFFSTTGSFLGVIVGGGVVGVFLSVIGGGVFFSTTGSSFLGVIVGGVFSKGDSARFNPLELPEVMGLVVRRFFCENPFVFCVVGGCSCGPERLVPYFCGGCGNLFCEGVVLGG